jgi:hypothetical protein
MGTTVDITGLLRKEVLVKKVLDEEKKVLVSTAANFGEIAARTTLDLAVTFWGQVRYDMGIGNSSGRNDTGSMINDLKATEPQVDGNVTVAKFGWVSDAVQPYYLEQEFGTAKIRAAMGLNNGLFYVKNKLPIFVNAFKNNVRGKVPH